MPSRPRRLLLVLGALVASAPPLLAQRAAPREVLLRLDDVGMNHSVNTAIARVAATKLPFSVSVMFACPWYQEAVEILRRNPQIAVGVHLTLNSEWRNYRWGPVLGKAGVPSLVDSAGYFVPSVGEFLARTYDLGEVERELGAQMDRAMASGLTISYVDAHMGMAVATPQLRAVLEKVARKYGVGISLYFGESYQSMWGVPIEAKKRELLAYVDSVPPTQTRMIEIHVAERTPEMEVLFDRNAAEQNSAAGLPLVARHRESELSAILSPEFAARVRSGKVRLVTYRDLIARAGGVAAMRAPR